MQQMQQSIVPTPGTRNGPDHPRFKQRRGLVDQQEFRLSQHNLAALLRQDTSAFPVA